MTTPNESLVFGSLERLNQVFTDALMIALCMVVGDELGNRASKMPLPIRIMRSRHSSLIDRTNRSAYALQMGARNGVRMIRTLVFKECQYATAPLPIAIADQYASIRQDAINRIRQVAQA